MLISPYRNSRAIRAATRHSKIVPTLVVALTGAEMHTGDNPVASRAPNDDSLTWDDAAAAARALAGTRISRLRHVEP